MVTETLGALTAELLDTKAQAGLEPATSRSRSEVTVTHTAPDSMADGEHKMESEVAEILTAPPSLNRSGSASNHAPGRLLRASSNALFS